jgi:hypothetical protein
MSQYERDIYLAIQQSLEEERKKQEALNVNNQTEKQPSIQTPTPGNVETGNSYF